MTTKRRKHAKAIEWRTANGPRYIARKGRIWDKLKLRFVPPGSMAIEDGISILNSAYESRIGFKTVTQ